MKNVITKLADQLSMTKKEATIIIDLVINNLAQEIKDSKKVKINGFGTFTVKVKPARKARNPKTGEEVSVAEKTIVAFKANPVFNEYVG
jgi:nucleoid DNA-binding protein